MRAFYPFLPTYLVQVSFTAIDSAQTVHISNVHKCKKVHFFIPEHKDETEVSARWAGCVDHG